MVRKKAIARAKATMKTKRGVKARSSLKPKRTLRAGSRVKVMKKGRTTLVKKAPVRKIVRKTSSVRKTTPVKRASVQRKTKWNDVHHEQQFLVNDGKILKNFTELPSALRNMHMDTFLHHVNDEKHDFANWVHDVMGAKTLAKQMRTARTKTALIRKIKAKI